MRLAGIISAFFHTLTVMFVCIPLSRGTSASTCDLIPKACYFTQLIFIGTYVCAPPPSFSLLPLLPPHRLRSLRQLRAHFFYLLGLIPISIPVLCLRTLSFLFFEQSYEFFRLSLYKSLLMFLALTLSVPPPSRGVKFSS